MLILRSEARSIQYQDPVAVALVVVPGWSELPRSRVRERPPGDAGVSSVRGIKPLGLGGRFQTRKVDRDRPRSRHVGDHKSAVRRLGGGAKIALADTGLEGPISSEPRSDYFMVLVRDQILPWQGRKKVLPNCKP